MTNDLHLVPMARSGFDDGVPIAVDVYAEGLIRNQHVDATAARAAGEKAVADLFPQGIDTPGMLFFDGLADGVKIGWVWLALKSLNTSHIYMIFVMEGSRGRGHGRALIQAVERELVGRGVRQITLNVFAYNESARRLYQSVGFKPVSQLMTKTINNCREPLM
ncbi:GNAT family N-acetyltransferase [Actinoplanes sp. TBRC 11911]|uniref:GNAT family N-acetyltransferase n=1 Tax=Actinoplanes sp. TBRC 11911 TaxID=2729386 RepID=UPI00145F3470|nr:GNAT family N-acetyltransferase [Actinoplanes sp. TBRC 11911]NMO53678.1 GNAT family N-acetyltransferase [Actinoplanes sp. TBRC 11911]